MQKKAIATALLGLLLAIPLHFYSSRDLDNWSRPDPTLDPSIVSGTYHNEECGSIRLENGRAFAGGSSTTYKVERAKDRSLRMLPEESLQFDWGIGGCQLKLAGPSKYVWQYKAGSLDVLDEDTSILVSFVEED